jgi:putative transposase
VSAEEDVAATAKPDTILGWYRKLIASKFDGSKLRRRVGRPKVDPKPETMTVTFDFSPMHDSFDYE